MKKLSLSIVILVALFPWSGVRAARLFDGTDDSLSASVDLSATNKLTIVCWLYWDSFANDDDLACEFSTNWNANTGSFVVDPNASAQSAFFVAFRGNSTSLATSVIFTRPSAATWHHYAWVVDMSLSTNEITACYVDGASQSLTYIVNNDNAGNFGNYTLYLMSRSGALFADGRLAEFAIYPGVNLSADEINTLYKGASPRMVRPTVKPYYWPLLGRTSPELELFFGATATVTGATQTDHPRIFLPR